MSHSEDSVGPPSGTMQDESASVHEALAKLWGPSVAVAEAARKDREAERMSKDMENIRRSEEAKLEREKLKVPGGSSRGGVRPAPAIGPGGLRILTDYDLPASDAQKWRVKNIVPDVGVGTIFGDSGTFKSFIALDLLAAIATGRELWFGYRVTQAACVYVPFEGKGGIPKRVEAWRLARQVERLSADPNALIFPIDLRVTTGIRFITDPMSLRTKEDRDKLVEALTAAGLAGGVLCIDTLAQAGGGIDENSSDGMGEMIAAFQDLQNRLGGVVLATHHTGKDASKGMRGHSSLRGAVDFAIECSRVEGPCKYDAQMSLDKVKDEEAGTVIPFTMRRVTLGVDDDGDFITSLVVVEPMADQGNMPTVQKPSDEQVSTRDDEFVWKWIRKENEAGTFPSKRSVSSQFKEMQPHLRKNLKRDEIRDAIERLVSKMRVKEEGGGRGGQKWLRAVDAMPVTTPATDTPSGDKT